MVFHEEVEQGSRPQVEGEESAHGVTTVFPLRGLVEEVVASCQAKKSGGELLARASRYLCHFLPVMADTSKDNCLGWRVSLVRV